jgi:hypothetical protein
LSVLGIKKVPRGLGKNSGNCQRKSAGIKFIVLLVICTFLREVKINIIIATVDF